MLTTAEVVVELPDRFSYGGVTFNRLKELMYDGVIVRRTGE